MIEINNAAGCRFDRRPLIKTAELFLKRFKLSGKDVSLAFVNSREMSRLNRLYRGKTGTTDVLSFEGEGDFLGEIVFDYDRIKKQAEELGHSAGKELRFILIHGLLHLCGHDDATDKKRLAMIELGDRLLSDFSKKGL